MKNAKLVTRSWSELPVLLTVGECAVVLRCDYESARKLVQAKKIPASKICGKWKIEKEKLQSFIERGEAV